MIYHSERNEIYIVFIESNFSKNKEQNNKKNKDQPDPLIEIPL